MAAKGRVFTGARAQLQVDGAVIGYCTQCNSREDISYERVKGLGSIETLEHVPVDYDCGFDAGFTRLVGETAKTLGLMPSVGANSDEHLQNILTQGRLTIVIVDKITGALIMTMEQAVCASSNLSLMAAGVSTSALTFLGVRHKDESEV